MANERIPILLSLPECIKFASCEPLLSKIELDWIDYIEDGYRTEEVINALNKDFSDWPHTENKSNLNWVIAGPETGPGKRGMKTEWIESLYLQCKSEKVPFFDKKNILKLGLCQLPKS